MTTNLTRILLIEDNPGDVRLIREMLREAEGAKFEMESVSRLEAGLGRLEEGGIDLVLLDLVLPDSMGLGSFVKIYSRERRTPIVVLTDLEDETLGLNAVKLGAQDYLAKSKVNSSQLVRVIRYAIERKKAEETIKELAHHDTLTGLPNRRGFSNLAQQQLNIANREKKGMLLLLANFDDLKSINDDFGHQEGDVALIEITDVLKETFRESDIIARIGGDEFAVLAIEDSRECSEILTNRLQKNIKARNKKRNYRYQLSIRVGIVQYDPEYPCSNDELLGKAEKLMDEHKYCNHLREKDYV